MAVGGLALVGGPPWGRLSGSAVGGHCRDAQPRLQSVFRAFRKASQARGRGPLATVPRAEVPERGSRAGRWSQLGQPRELLHLPRGCC